MGAEKSIEAFCRKPVYGPLGSCVGYCDLDQDHDGPCKCNGVSEQDMVDVLAEQTNS